ncbi:hypothetical protein DSM3645_05680 [Blastopirellula marina DSM 3645]|uniref:Uncharacterized protein n=1 Tax=Blastopirellula marina DSM 3645 TaxID=314230 RepID=A3ZU25_9BACT|nr:hypothetical protein DSM3645_05680 [Blastopirellula marina DSM 3645]
MLEKSSPHSAAQGKGAVYRATDRIFDAIEAVDVTAMCKVRDSAGGCKGKVLKMILLE